MSDPKFTPGPWSVSPFGEVVGQNDESVCIVLLGDEGPSNTHLIAAAPDLWNALTTLQYQLRWSWNALFANGETEHAEALRHALAGVDAALAKARGEP